MQFAQANAQTKNCKRASTFATRRKNYFLKSLPSKIFKTANTQAKQTENEINKMTEKAQIYNDLTLKEDRRPAYNSTYKKLAVQWLNEVQFFNQTLVQVDSFVLRNRQLLIAGKTLPPMHKDNNIDLDQAVFTTKNVMKNKMTIVRTYHDHDGSWQFFDAVSTNSNENIMLVSLQEILDTDPSINEIINMEVGYFAEREEQHKQWSINPFEAESEDD